MMYNTVAKGLMEEVETDLGHEGHVRISLVEL